MFLLANIPGFVYWILGIFLIIIIIIVLLTVITKRVSEKRRKDCFNLLNKICVDKLSGNFKLEISNNNIYDFLLETDRFRYLIKLIINVNNQEICVNNAIKWQLRNSAYEKEIRFVDGVEQLMRLDLKKDNKETKKLFIIYPNARALLKVINECEMVFITPETDVYGAKILTYNQLVENKDLLAI